MRILITGSAGFIGFHLARRFLDEGHDVVGFDGLTPYYDVALKRARHAALGRYPRFRAVIGLLERADDLARAFALAEPELVLHLAAQAGVRYSLQEPKAYVDSNLVGSWMLLECARQGSIKHLMLASTSSVYGEESDYSRPFQETDPANAPLTLYAASKKSMEMMAHAYAHLYHIPTTAFRFFTIYGPWGRPDMALFKFTEAILRDEPIEIYGEGKMRRDFTFIDDLVEAVVRLSRIAPDAANRVAGKESVDSLSPMAPFRIVNIAGGVPVNLLDFIATLEDVLGRRARRLYLPLQAGDARQTFADPALLQALTGFRPATLLREGIAAFARWYEAYRREHGAPC